MSRFTAPLKIKGSPLGRGKLTTATVIEQSSQDVDEGWQRKKIDKYLTLTGASVDIGEDVPAGARIISTQTIVKTLIVAGGTSTNYGVGIAADPDKYGNGNALTVNSKSKQIGPDTVLALAEDVKIFPTTGAGAAGDTNFTSGVIRLTIEYEFLADLQSE